MQKFKVGDRVKLTDNDYYHAEFGSLGTIIRDDGDEAPLIKWDNKGEWYCNEDRLEIHCEPSESDSIVHSPTHYTQGEIETIDYIKDTLTPEEFKGYIKGNVIKYISRELLKGKEVDLQKAEWYLHYLNTGEK